MRLGFPGSIGHVLGATSGMTLSTYTEANSILALRNEATSGTTEGNRGTGGSALNATISGATLGQSIGAQPAFDFDGVDDVMSIPNHASLANMTTQRWAFLLHPDSLGESSFGTLMAWGNGGVSNQPIIRLGVPNRLRVVMINATPTLFAWESTDNQISNLIGANGWIFVDYDDATSRKVRMWKAVGGTLTQLTLAIDSTLTGTFRAPTDSLYLGNISNLTQTVDGKMGRILANNSLWTTAEMNRIIALGGV